MEIRTNRRVRTPTRPKSPQFYASVKGLLNPIQRRRPAIPQGLHRILQPPIATTDNVDPFAPQPYYWHMSSKTASALDSPTTHQVELQQFNAAYIGAFDAGNAQALAALFTEDSLVMNTFGKIVSGRSAIMTALEHSFAGPCQGATLSITPHQSKHVSEDVVVEQGTSRTTLKIDPPTYRDFSYTKVFVRQGDLWRIAAVQFANLQPTQPKSS